MALGQPELHTLSGFLYFVPSVPSGELKEQLASVAYAFEGEQYARAEVPRDGPEGQPGLIVGNSLVWPTSERAKLGYFPERQTWRKIPGTSLHVGFYNDARPGPDDLQRQALLDGRDVELCDGNAWSIPIARQYQGGGEFANRIPSRLETDENGDWVDGKPLERWANLWEVCERWFDRFRGADESEHTLSDEIKDAVQVLESHYFIGETEASMLGILSGPHCATILYVLVDAHGYMAAKKKAPGGSDSSPGQPDTDLITDQPSQI